MVTRSHVIDANDMMSLFQKTLNQMATYEARTSSHNRFANHLDNLQ
jgi:hypothetical protein